MPDQLMVDQQGKPRTVWWLTGIVVGMFGFGFAMVPLYQLFCTVTGIGTIEASGRARIETQEISLYEVDESRNITLEFDTTLNQDLEWEFRPMTKTMQVHPGEVSEVNYLVRNKTDREIVAQAIPGVTPWQATKYLKKIECFCFTQQTLKPGESREMPLRYVIDPALPDKFRTVTLSYTIMDTQNRNSSKAEVSEYPSLVSNTYINN